MAFIKTTLTDDLTGKNSDFCFNTEYVIAMQPTRIATILTFSDGQKLIVDVPFEKLTKFVGAKENFD
ncbi:MAG TPA: hypothetical protein VFF11_00850 [Candidatus Binatia bacterium]|nr:hypothetical protein [Candidatus Binatia bacterium]